MGIKKKIQITLSVEATKKYFELAEAKALGEAQADIENSGTCLVIETWILGASAYWKIGNELSELGDANLRVIEVSSDDGVDSDDL